MLDFMLWLVFCLMLLSAGGFIVQRIEGRSAAERKEAICWVLRHGTLNDTDDLTLMFPARFIGKVTGLPLTMVFKYTKELIREGVLEARIASDGQHVYRIADRAK